MPRMPKLERQLLALEKERNELRVERDLALDQKHTLTAGNQRLARLLAHRTDQHRAALVFIRSMLGNTGEQNYDLD